MELLCFFWSENNSGYDRKTLFFSCYHDFDVTTFISDVLVHSCCYNKHHRLGSLWTVVLEAGSPGDCHGWVLVEALLQAVDFPLRPHVVAGTRDLSGTPFIRPLISIVRALFL